MGNVQRGSSRRVIWLINIVVMRVKMVMLLLGRRKSRSKGRMLCDVFEWSVLGNNVHVVFQIFAVVMRGAGQRAVWKVVKIFFIFDLFEREKIQKGFDSRRLVAFCGGTLSANVFGTDGRFGHVVLLCPDAPISIALFTLDMNTLFAFSASDKLGGSFVNFFSIDELAIRAKLILVIFQATSVA